MNYMSRVGVVAVVVLVLLAGCSAVPGAQPTDDTTPTVTETPSETPPTTNSPTSTSTPSPTATDTPEPTATSLPTDSDSLSRSEEERLGTDRSDPDTDGDGLQDGKEVNKWDTDPTDPDTDGDGLKDTKETFMDTSPTNPDSDDDGLEDGREVEAGSDPMVQDTDEDGVSDAEEVEQGLDPTDPNTDNDIYDDSEDPDSTLYHDGDGISPSREKELGTNPKQADSDDDNLRDDRELKVGTDPLNSDTDDDALLDGDEYHGNQSGVPLPDADPLHYDIYVQEVVTPNGKKLPDKKKEWVSEQYAQFNVKNVDGDTGVNLHWVNTTTTDKSTNKESFRSSDFRTEQTNPYVVVVQDADGNQRIQGLETIEGVVWTDEDGSYRTQAWVDGHEILHLVQSGVLFEDGCVDPSHACDSWLDYDLENTSLPDKLIKRINERGLWDDEAPNVDGPW